jgi:hypothetical protein
MVVHNLGTYMIFRNQKRGRMQGQGEDVVGLIFWVIEMRWKGRGLIFRESGWGRELML